MPEVTDWKAKHLNALREMEAEERRWRGVEQVLRRLVNRLCAAAMGIDERLDAQLSRLAEANRRSADVAELTARHDSLSDALKALEGGPAARPPSDFTATLSMAKPRVATAPAVVAAAPPAPVARLEASRSAAARLVGELTATGPAEPRLQELAARLGEATSDAILAEILTAIADLVGARASAIAAEREATAAVLKQVTERLEEMADYLAGLNGDRKLQLDAAETLNASVMSQVSRLSAEARAAKDLPALQSLIAERLESVASQVRDFHTREGQRFVEHNERAEKMRARISELELESRELNRTLEHERRRSRLDALTRIANRTAFDERLAEEIPRWKRFGTPVTVLVWDIDRFKAINDTYGHRVGDAVLREVAACLSARLRNTDLVARYGGEEFGMLMVGSTAAQALVVADELRAAIQGLGFHFKGAPVVVTASCGLTEIREGDTTGGVFDRADRALYDAKGRGRNCCVIG